MSETIISSQKSKHHATKERILSLLLNKPQAKPVVKFRKIVRPRRGRTAFCAAFRGSQKLHATHGYSCFATSWKGTHLIAILE
jgi:hypothetical protein